MLREKTDIVSVISFGIALRAIISLYSYSGKNKPPIFGDYEAQRHWQEITVNLDAKEWYRNSSANDLLYWGLDYPPLSAYHSYLVGKTASMVDNKFVALYESRGFESRSHQAFMRLSVLLADVFVFIPGIVSLGLALRKTFRKEIFIAFITLAVLFPGQILIDNGHFQYNNISLGLAAFTIAALLFGRDYLASFLFTLAINYKQMELYHALPVFVFLLHRCISGPQTLLQKCTKFFGVASVVLLTFTAVWLPWLSDLNSTTSVIKRLFPINRGIFEDKVANFWCALNVLYKIKKTFLNEQMALISLLTTAAVVLPINGALFISHCRDKLLYALFNTALAFFLFSFQVHEKSILLVTLPCCCLIGMAPDLTIHLLQCALFSMFPLFIKDDLVLPFFALVIIYSLIISICKVEILENKVTGMLYNALMICQSVLSVFTWINPTHYKYPHIWPLIVAIFSFVNFVFCLLFGIYKQLS